MDWEKLRKTFSLDGRDARECAVASFREYQEWHAKASLGDGIFEVPQEAGGRSAHQATISSSSELYALALRLTKCGHDGYFVIRVCLHKISQLVQALCRAIEDNNAISLANNTRALVEHAAALAYVGQKMIDLISGLGGQTSEHRITEVLGRYETVMRRIYYGGSPKGKGTTREKAPHVTGDYLFLLEKDLPVIKDVYEFLCEYVHPNYGSNTLVSSGALSRGRLGVPCGDHPEVLKGFFLACYICIEYVREKAFRLTALAIQINEMANNCHHPGATVRNVFVSRKVVLEGDGLSRDSAIFFPNALSPFDDVQMTMKFLRELCPDENPIREYGPSIGCFIYVIYSTSKGKMWFKYNTSRMSSGRET